MNSLKRFHQLKIVTKNWVFQLKARLLCWATLFDPSVKKFHRSGTLDWEKPLHMNLASAGSPMKILNLLQTIAQTYQQTSTKIKHPIKFTILSIPLKQFLLLEAAQYADKKAAGLKQLCPRTLVL